VALSFALLFGPFVVFGLEDTADMAEKKKATPLMASITSFSRKHVEAICNVAVQCPHEELAMLRDMQLLDV
jgi:hypothetical protein